MPDNYSFVVPGQLAGMAWPGSAGRELRRNLEALVADNVGGMVSLSEDAPDRSEVTAAGLRHLHVPIVDFMPPEMKEISRVVAFVRDVIASGRAVVLHCHAGVGRTGTMLAAYLVAMGERPEVAINTVRRIRPESIDTVPQENAVFDWADHIRSNAA